MLTITGSGNEGRVCMNLTRRYISNRHQDYIDGWPAVFAHSGPEEGQAAIASLVVVGAVEVRTNTMWTGTNVDTAKGLPHLYAPGDVVDCADPLIGDRSYRSARGTSVGGSPISITYRLSIPWLTLSCRSCLHIRRGRT